MVGPSPRMALHSSGTFLKLCGVHTPLIGQAPFRLSCLSCDNRSKSRERINSVIYEIYMIYELSYDLRCIRSLATRARLAVAGEFSRSRGLARRTGADGENTGGRGRTALPGWTVGRSSQVVRAGGRNGYQLLMESMVWRLVFWWAISSFFLIFLRWTLTVPGESRRISAISLLRLPCLTRLAT